MDDEKLQKFFIPHLRSQFEQGQAVLFVGAGFSLGAKNFKGELLPSVKELTREYWRICYPAQDFDESTALQDIYEAAHLRHAARLRQVTIDRLSVDGRALPKWYEPYVEMPWLRIYSLNIDDLLESAGRVWSLSRRVAPLSATSSTVKQRPPASADAVELIHLNGTLDDVPDSVTFSVSQYAERLANNDPWYAQLVTDLLSRSIVFVGSNLDEPPLWQHVVLRANRGARGNAELRHRSYLISPRLSAARQALLSQHNVEWLPFDAEQFSVRVLSECRSSIAVGLRALSEKYSAVGLSKGHPKLPIVADLVAKPATRTEYLLGQEPTWGDIQTGRAAERTIDADILNTANHLLTGPQAARFLVITGTAGSGKSTSLMRLGLKLSSSGKVVGWVDRDSDVSPRNIRQAMETASAPQVLAIEDADLYGSELVPLVHDLLGAPVGPLIILEIRSGRIDRALPHHACLPCRPTEIPMPPLSDKDIDEILVVLDRENRLGNLKGLSKAAQVEAFRKQAGRELLVAMYQATTGFDFKSKMVKELMELQGTAQFIYALVALTSAHRFTLTQDEVIIAVADRSNSALNEIRTLLSRHLIVKSRDGFALQARHRVIATVLFDALIQSGQLFELIYGVIIAAASKHRESEGPASRASRMLRTFLNHDFLSRTLGREQTRNLYGRCESFLRDDFHYWLHRGAIEVEQGDLALAENFLGQAKGLAPADAYVLNEWAYLLFRKAIDSPASPEAERYVSDAVKILTSLVTDRRIPNAYAYHVLGSQGLAWSRRGIASKVARGEFLRFIKGKLSEGREACKDDVVLRQLEEDVTKEMLVLAVVH